jgi:hypothetical protein
MRLGILVTNPWFLYVIAFQNIGLTFVFYGSCFFLKVHNAKNFSYFPEKPRDELTSKLSKNHNFNILNSTPKKQTEEANLLFKVSAY